MSTPDKPDHARGWLYVEKLLGDEEDERVKNLSDDELRAELRQGEDSERDPGAEWSADDLLARAEALAAKKPPPAVRAAPDAPPPPLPGPARVPPAKTIGPVVPIRKTWRTVAFLAAACFALFLFVSLGQGPHIAMHPASHRQLAEWRRDAAETSCAREDWMACKASLDEALSLDPVGESEPRVQKARQEIAVGLAGHSVEAGGPEKPEP